MFRPLAPLCLVLALAGCGTASISQSLIAENELIYLAGGVAEYPIVIDGAEEIGLTPAAVAQGLRFPNSHGGAADFEAVAGLGRLSSYATLRIEGGARLAKSTLAFFRDGERIGLGTFSIPQDAYAEPEALGRVSARLIVDMFNEANRRSSDERRWRWHF